MIIQLIQAVLAKCGLPAIAKIGNILFICDRYRQKFVTRIVNGPVSMRIVEQRIAASCEGAAILLSDGKGVSKNLPFQCHQANAQMLGL